MYGGTAGGAGNGRGGAGGGFTESIVTPEQKLSAAIAEIKTRFVAAWAVLVAHDGQAYVYSVTLAEYPRH